MPVDQFRKDYAFTVPSLMTNNFVYIVKPLAQPGKNAPTVFIDDVAIPESSFSNAIGGTFSSKMTMSRSAIFPGKRSPG